jgi:hypothetical protein
MASTRPPASTACTDPWCGLSADSLSAADITVCTAVNALVSEQSHRHCGGDFFRTPYPPNRFLRNRFTNDGSRA